MSSGRPRPAVGLPVSLDDVVEQLVTWRRDAGSPSYAEIARRVRQLRAGRGLPAAESAVAKTTVYDCFRGDRRRLDIELVVDIARALGLDEHKAPGWEMACWAAQHHVEASRVVSVGEVLPTAVERFVGRRAEIERLVAAEPVVSVIVGMAGTGKTQLAVHVARELVRAGTVDRVVHADLRGFDPERPPAEPTAIVNAVARQLGVDPRLLPGDEPARRRALGTHLADQRVLLVLDDAAGPEQVTGIVPDQPDLPILVTSRVAFAAMPPIVPVPLGPFSNDEAIDLLRSQQVASIETESAAAHELVKLVGCLPLAVEILGSRIATRPGWSLDDHVRALGKHRELFRLDEPVRAAIDLSYRALGAPAQRTLRLLATQPCSAVGTGAIAALVDADPDETRAVVGELQAANMVTVAGDDRVGLHALVRAHAAGLALDEDRPSERDEASARLHDHMVATTWAAVRALEGELASDQRCAVDQEAELLDPDGAARWLETEHGNLLTLAEPSREPVRATIAIELSEALAKHLDGRGLLHDAAILHERALATARDLGDRDGERLAALHLGQALVRLAELDRAALMLERAGAAAEEAGDRATVMRVASTLAIVDARAGRLDDALDRFRTALATARELGAQGSVAAALDNIAIVCRRLGDLDAAAEHHRLAHAHAVAHGVDELAANSLMNLSDVLLAQGDAAAALDTATRSREACRRGGFAATEGYAITNIGLALVALGRADDGIAHHEAALDQARAIGMRSLEATVRNNLGLALAADGRHGDAAEMFRAAQRLAIEIGDVLERGRADAGLAGQDARPA